jgi:hypothetical protein
VKNDKFVDLAFAKAEFKPVKFAECGSTTNKRACLRISGPNGGAGACRYNTKKKICVKRATFVDNPPPELVDCSPGDYKRAVCLAILGPKGGANACKFNLNRNAKNYKWCINNNAFVDL